MSSKTSSNEMEIVTPVSSNISEMEISSPVNKKGGVMLYELGYLLEKLEKENNNEQMIDIINEMVEILRPLIILYDADTFYLQDDINKYIDILNDIFTNHKKLIKYIFKIDRIIPINSANGRIFILKTLSNKYKTSKLLVKVAAREISDPISYEYYVGLALNRLRVNYNIDFFAIMYGRFFCGLDPKVDVNEDNLDEIELCDNRYSKKTHLLYEFIRNIETEEVLTLSDYIETLKNDNSLDKEINIINIMILVLYALQEAQDKMEFTHYDLHSKNILVVKLSEIKEYKLIYKGEVISIITDVVPHIIDYGRSHINPETAISENGVFKDYEWDVEFSDFEMYQNVLFKKYVLDRNKNGHLEKIKKIERHLNKLVNRYLYKIESVELEESVETLEFKRGILEVYYNGEFEIVDNEFKIKKCDFGIDTRRSHKKYDFFRICRIVGGMISNISKQKELYSKNIWKNLGDKLELQYPYYDGWYYSLVSDYKPNPIGIMTDDSSFNEPIDIVNYLYNKIYDKEQYGGGDKKNGKEKDNNNINMNNEKINRLESIKKKLENEKIKYEFMDIDYSDMNTGSFNMKIDNENTNKN